MAKMFVVETTEDFPDLQLAHERGWHRNHYLCPTCNVELYCETVEKGHVFSSNSILTVGLVPRFCPECGTKVEKE